MCLGIPMQIIAVDGYLARCSAKEIEREVSLFLLQDDPV
jgi:hydrogenase expression/formation protein HypC